MIGIRRIGAIFLGWLIVIGSASGPVQAGEIAPLLEYYSQDYWVLMGGSKDGKWLTAEAVEPQLKGRQRYRLYRLTGPIGTALGGKAGPWGQADPPFLVRLKPILQIQDLVAVGGPWNAMPRKPRLLDENLQPYVEAAKEILKSKGIADPQVNLTQVIEIDLDGDGVKEVLVCARRFTAADDSDYPKEGDYSMVFVQKKAKGPVSNILIAGQFQTAFQKEPEVAKTYRVAGLVDANGDGVVEILVGYSYYEGGGAQLYQLKGDQVELVLGMDWGL